MNGKRNLFIQRYFCSLSLIGLLFQLTTTVNGDTIFKITGGKESVYVENVLVERNEIGFGQDHNENYKLRVVDYRTIIDGIVENPSLICDFRKGEDARVAVSSIEERERILKNWRDNGTTATVVDVEGAETEVANLALRFMAPLGYSLLTSPKPQRGLSLVREERRL